MIAERILMGVLIGGIALGCGVVLYPFFSALLWAAILVFATWPVAQWLERNLRVHKAIISLLMVLCTALILVLPLALVAPGGAEDVRSLRIALEAWLANVPPSPHWLHMVPVVGSGLAATWDAWASDLSEAVSFFRPYLGVAVERGLRLVLSVAGGLAQLGVALFAAFFFWMNGAALAETAQELAHRVAGRYAPELIAATANTVRGAVYGILGTAILQGFLTAFGLTAAGVPRPVLLGTVTAFLAV
ncbi:MAG TPA: AI-2E family transporter, partial [Acetobacteraceae bacterium]|nr:AI-2E family transporter [Acetobacteraceae bacterium]